MRASSPSPPCRFSLFILICGMVVMCSWCGRQQPLDYLQGPRDLGLLNPRQDPRVRAVQTRFSSLDVISDDVYLGNWECAVPFRRRASFVHI
jgi:hypothetical protein